MKSYFGNLKKYYHASDKISLLRGFFLLSFFVLVSIAIMRYIGEEAIEQRIASAGIRGPIILILRKATTVIIVPFSGTATYIIAGSIYGVRLSTLYTAIGNFIGVSVAFVIGRKWGTQAIEKMIGPKHINEIVHLIDHLGDTKKFIITRITLFPLEDLINYAGGISKISYSKFIVISIIIATLHALIPIVFGNWIL